MIQKIINNKKFGPIAVGNPTLTGFPKHSNVADCLNDRRVVSFDLFEVRSQTKVHCLCSEKGVTCPGTLDGVEIPRETSKLMFTLESKFRSEKNPKPRFRLEMYDYVQN